MSDYDLIIVGAGPAGLTAALYAGRSMLRAVLLEKGVPGGELLNTELIEDYPGFESIKGFELAERMTAHAVKFGAELVTDSVASVEREADGRFLATTDGGQRYRAPVVLVTAGGTPTKLGVPGEVEYAGKGVSYCAVCDGHFFRGEVLGVVGGGDAAVEEAEFLTRYASTVYLIHRRDRLRASKIIQQRLFANPKIEVVWNTVVERIEGRGTSVTHLALKNVETGAATALPVGGVFVFV
ncbi:MAG: thioredoxin-disulfide reductase, partial [Gemmatimonadetes bacterium 21-71-4]